VFSHRAIPLTCGALAGAYRRSFPCACVDGARARRSASVVRPLPLCAGAALYDGETCSAECGRVSQHVAKLCGGYFDGYASVGGMLNTSASPNAELRSSGGVWARRVISRGEEILIPYGKSFRVTDLSSARRIRRLEKKS